MAKQLPFKTAPKAETQIIGNDQIGELEFPKLGDLTVREQAFINERLGKHSTFLEIARLSNKVAKAQKIQPVAAHRFLTKCATNALQGGVGVNFDSKEENMRVKFAREIEDLIQFLLKEQWERQLITVAALCRFRLEGAEDFDVEDARDLPQALVQQIYGFSLVEQGAASSDEEQQSEAEAEKELEDQLGK